MQLMATLGKRNADNGDSGKRNADNGDRAKEMPQKATIDNGNAARVSK